jgi:hypothetical protein
MISAIDKVDALLSGITRDDLVRLQPIYRKRLAAALRRVADLCDPPAKSDPPKSGILAALRECPRAE